MLKRKNFDAGMSSKRFKTQKFRAKPNAKPTARQVKNMVEQAIYRNSETKIVTSVVAEQSVNTIGSAQLLPVPVPSDGAKGNERIGNKVRGVGISSKLLFHNNNTSETIWIRALLLEVLDGQMTDTEVRNNLFEGTSDQTIGEAGSQFELIRRIDREYFKVLRDVNLPLGLKASSEGHQMINYYKKLQGQEMKFNDSVATAPTNSSRFVWVVLAREADADEGVGSVIECTYSLDYYYKE